MKWVKIYSGQGRLVRRRQWSGENLQSRRVKMLETPGDLSENGNHASRSCVVFLMQQFRIEGPRMRRDRAPASPQNSFRLAASALASDFQVKAPATA